MLNDEEIIEQFKKGNEEVFKVLINRYSPSLFNFILRLTDKNNAPDIIQDTFIKVWKNLKKFDPSKASFKTWIFTIARNTATDFLRKKKFILFSDIEKNTNTDSNTNEYDFLDKVPDEEILPDEALQKLQDIELLNKILNNLTSDYKMILVLHYQEEMTFDEISKVLEKPLNTIKSQHRRAIIELRKMIKF